MHAKPERCDMNCLELAFKKDISDIVVKVEIHVRNAASRPSRLQCRLQRGDPLRGSEMLIGLQIADMLAPLPSGYHFVGNAGNSGLRCDPVAELMCVHFEEAPAAVCKSEPLECGSNNRSSSLRSSSEKIVDRLLRQRLHQGEVHLALLVLEVAEHHKETLRKHLFGSLSPGRAALARARD